MSDHIPEGVLIDILKRLTVEDLVRCTGVCRSWYSLITSPYFISLQISATTNTDLLLVRDCIEEYKFDAPKKDKYSIYLHNDDDDTFPVHKSIDFSFKNHSSSYFRVIGCCNGVICLSNDLSSILHDIILWNPFNRKSLTLPRPLVPYTSHGPFKGCIGFGFNAATNDFKVVYFTGSLCLRDGPPMVEVYDLSVGSWTSVDAKGFSHNIHDFASQVFLNNAVHWVGYNRIKVVGEYFNMIVSFDLRTDVFGMIKLPHSVADFLGYCSVSTCGESLALIQTILSENYQKTCCVWVMKQYGVADSWTKLFNIDLTGGLSEVCGVLKNEEALVIVSEHPYSYRRKEALVSYEPKRKRRNRIGEIRNSRPVFVDYFVETLALLGMKHANSDNTLASKQSIP